MSADLDPTEVSHALAEVRQSIERQGQRTERALADAASTIATQLSHPLAELESALHKRGVSLERAVAGAVAAAAASHRTQPPQQAAVQPPAGWVFKLKYHDDGSLDELIARRIDA